MVKGSISRAVRALSGQTKAATPAKTNAVGVRQVPVQQTEFKHSLCYGKSCDMTVESGSGCYVTTTSGRKLLDVTSGIAVLSTGHCHPRVVEAVQQQASKLLHGQLNCFQSHTALDDLMGKLGRVMPSGLDTFVVDTTGTQAIEAAVKLARRHTGRPNIIAMSGGFHGRTAMCSALTSSNTGPRYPVATPLPSGVHFTQPPLAFRHSLPEDEAVDRALKSFSDIFRSQAPASSFAAVLAEPILGEGGFIPLPDKYVLGIKALCEEHGILFIADEVQAGAGRSGKMWASQHVEGFTPDILVSAKGIASGMPLSVVASTKEIMECYTPGTHGGTYMGNPVACAAASATLDVMRDEQLPENAKRQGNLLLNLLGAIKTTYLPGCDVRGRGLMVALECRHEGAASPELAQFIRRRCLEESDVLLYAPSGWDGCTLRVMPPLIVTEAQVTQIASAIESAAAAWNESH